MQAKHFYALTALGISLAGCGGGGSTTQAPATPAAAPTVAVSGTVAVGAPLANAAVALKCKGGNYSGITTDATGAWSKTIPAASFPCAAQATDGVTTLHSMLDSAGSASAIQFNITSLTELMISRHAGQSPAAWFQGLNATALDGITSGALQNALTAVKAGLPAGVQTALGNDDPVRVAFVANQTGHDAVLDQLKTALASAGITLATASGNLASGGANPMIPAYIASLSVASGAAGSTVTIRGHELPASAVVLFGSTAGTGATTNGARTEITVTVPAIGAGAANVTVQGSAGQLAFTVAAGSGSGGGGTGGSGSGTGFFGTQKTAASVAFLNGKSFAGTNCSIAFDNNGTVTITDTAQSKTASASFSGDALDIITALGSGNTSFYLKPVDGAVTAAQNGNMVYATGTSSAYGRIQIADYHTATPYVVEGYVNRSDGNGNVTAAACNNVNKTFSWTPPVLSSGTLDFLAQYSTDLSKTLTLATHVPHLKGSYTGLAGTGSYKRLILQPTFSVAENLTQKACSLVIDDQGNATLTVDAKVKTFSLLNRAMTINTGLALPIAGTSTSEYVKGYSFWASGGFGDVNNALFWIDASNYTGPQTLNYKESTSSQREEMGCTFK